MEEEEEFTETASADAEEDPGEDVDGEGEGELGSEDAAQSAEQGNDQEEEEEASDEEDEEPPSLDVLNIDLNFDDMEEEFKGVLEELAADPQLERFRVEYGKLHAALQRSHQNERCLMDKYRELQAEIAAHSSEMATALKLAAEDKQTIDALKKEVEKAWKMLDLAHEREQEAKETMETLQGEIARMHELAGQGNQISAEQQEAMDELSDTKAEVTRERNELLAEVTKLRGQMEQLMTVQDSTEKHRQDLEAKLQNMAQEMQVYRSDLQRESRRKDRAERDHKMAKAEIEEKQADIRHLQKQLDQTQEQIDKTNIVLREQKAMHEETMKENEQLAEKCQRLQQDYEEALLGLDQLTQENKMRMTEIKEREEELAALNQEALRLSRLRDTMARKLRTAEELREEVEAQRETTSAEASRLEHELEAARRQMEADRRAMDDLRHERELLKKAIINSQAVCKKLESTLKLHDQGKRQLERETGDLRHAILRQKFIIAHLQRDRDRSISAASDLTNKNVALVEDIKLKELEIFDFKRRVAESDCRLKQQQSLYEAVRSDRNLYSKNLIESQNEVAEMKRKFKIIMHQIDQLKEETAAREALLAKEQLALLRVQKDKETLVADLEELRLSATRMKATIASMEMEQQKLTKVLADGEAERNKQRKDINQVMTERDILGTQLVRRNDELGLLYEKIRIQQSTLSKGEQQYRERINDIRLLKLEIKKLRREKSLLNRSVHNLEDMRREMYHMHRSLLKERSKCKALENELQNPQNVHRWRRLEGTDPSAYEMVLKIQTLQRRLIAKTQDATKKELDIQEKERLYLELKQILSRQPGPEVAEQLLLCQATIRQKNRQMKSLVSELNMYDSQIQDYKRDIDRLTEQLGGIKRLYASQKKQGGRLKHQLRLASQAARPLPRLAPISEPSVRRPPLGGGFKLPSLSTKT